MYELEKETKSEGVFLQAKIAQWATCFVLRIHILNKFSVVKEMK